MTTPIADQILTSLSLHGRLLPRALSDIVMSHEGCEDGHAVNAEIVRLIDAGQIKVDGAYLEHVEPERSEEDDLAAYFRAADAYRAQMARRRGFWSWVGVRLAIAWEKFLAAWDRIWPGVVLIIATSGFALGLCAQEGEWRLCEVTAYAGNCPLCETTGVTANGTETNERPYGVAASPDIRLGSVVTVPTGAGYLDVSHASDRTFICDDRGGALRSEWRRSGITRLDLRYVHHSSAKKFGRKLMMVYICEPSK